MVVLALGADIKNRFLLVKDKNFYFGPTLGDLSLIENYSTLRKEVYKIIKKQPPQKIVCDLHPGYLSSFLAEEVFYSLTEKGLKLNLIKVQHHFAHLGSLILEQSPKLPLIGVCFDGTGFGLDGNIWGGEFILVWKEGFKRVGHFTYIKMPGIEKVIYQPWRMVLSILGKDAFNFLKKVKREDKEAVLKMLSKNINCPLTSSVGRLFDAVSALLGLCLYASYEAEAPLKLEKICKEEIEGFYPVKIDKNNGVYLIDSPSLFGEILKDLKRKTSQEVIATKFHNSIANVSLAVVRLLSKEYNTKRVGLSGGVFQNNFLRKKLIEKLSQEGFEVFANQAYPLNDLNIAVGQYYVSCRLWRN